MEMIEEPNLTIPKEMTLEDYIKMCIADGDTDTNGV